MLNWNWLIDLGSILGTFVIVWGAYMFARSCEGPDCSHEKHEYFQPPARGVGMLGWRPGSEWGFF